MDFHALGELGKTTDGVGIVASGGSMAPTFLGFMLPMQHGIGGKPLI
jgi:hypothetical protein